MSIALITGSSGLIGSEAAEFFIGKGFEVAGIDNNMRQKFFGPEASTERQKERLSRLSGYQHFNVDIRDYSSLESLYKKYGKSIEVIIHTAAQPSHDWAAREPLTDFGVNATGTLHLLELTRVYCPQAVFIFTSTNKVYGDHPNALPFVENKDRWDLPEDHPLFHGIDEKMSIDGCTHSLFGASKVAADLLVQEYGRYFGLKTVCFRCGCLTGPNHAGVEQHGFLSYLIKCGANGRTYTIYGYKGKQVRDNIHSFDLVNAFYHYFQNPRSGEVYNMGGGRENSCSILELVILYEKLFRKSIKTMVVDQPRIGDHIWYISNNNKFRSHYGDWKVTKSITEILGAIAETFIIS